MEQEAKEKEKDSKSQGDENSKRASWHGYSIEVTSITINSNGHY